MVCMPFCTEPTFSNSEVICLRIMFDIWLRRSTSEVAMAIAPTLIEPALHR